jgi:hypothetical protein
MENEETNVGKGSNQPGPDKSPKEVLNDAKKDLEEVTNQLNAIALAKQREPELVARANHLQGIIYGLELVLKE